jgi:tRNA threonylcarbamoyladenosine biosynthesis protein TsaE
MKALLTSRSAAATELAAEAVAGALGPGDVVLIAGELGAGKTTFVRGACRGLGVRARVTSPSFTIGQVYEGRVRVSHLDLFRLGSLEVEDPSLLTDYLLPDAVAFVEWPAAGEPEIEPGRVALRLRLEHAGGDSRRVEANGRTAVVERLRAALTDGDGEPGAGRGGHGPLRDP